MTSWHHKISLIYFHFNYGKTSSIWSFRPIASSPPITLGRSPPEIRKCAPSLTNSLSLKSFSSFLYKEKYSSVFSSHCASNGRAEHWEQSKRSSEQSKAKQTKHRRTWQIFDLFNLYCSRDVNPSLKHMLSLHCVHLTCSQRSLLCITVWLFLASFKVSGWTLHEASETLA